MSDESIINKVGVGTPTRGFGSAAQSY